MPKRVAAIGVSHWHSAYDASYLCVLQDLGCDIVGVSDRDERIAKNRAERFDSTPFTDYRRMVEATKPEFVVALGRHCDLSTWRIAPFREVLAGLTPASIRRLQSIVVTQIPA